MSQPAGEGTPSSGTGLARAQTIASFAMAYNWGYEGFTQAQRDWILERVNEGFDTYGTASRPPEYRIPAEQFQLERCRRGRACHVAHRDGPAHG